MPPVKIVRILFQETIPPQKLPLFRGVMINMSDNNVLFHNHMGDNYRYSYPKIQYKLANSHPALIGINEGADALLSMQDTLRSFYCRLGQETTMFNLAFCSEEQTEIAVDSEVTPYLLYDWLPLNSRNLVQYSNADGLAERTMILESILTGNILSMAKGLDIHLDSRIICKIDDFSHDGKSDFKGIGMENFKVRFRCNVTLPEGIGLGKSASQNHGTIIKLN